MQISLISIVAQVDGLHRHFTRSKPQWRLMDKGMLGLVRRVRLGARFGNDA